ALNKSRVFLQAGFTCLTAQAPVQNHPAGEIVEEVTGRVLRKVFTPNNRILNDVVQFESHFTVQRFITFLVLTRLRSFFFLLLRFETLANEHKATILSRASLRYLTHNVD